MVDKMPEDGYIMAPTDNNPNRGSDTETDSTKHQYEVLRLFELMVDLSDKHDADSALLEKRDDGTVGIVLEFNLPNDD